MVEPVANADELDECLKDMIRAVYAACSTALPHLNDSDPSVADKAIKDSAEVLGLVMDGKVEEWVA
jgi:hypothetical protein